MEKTTWETITAVVIGILIGVFSASAFWLVKTNKISFPSSGGVATQNENKNTPTPTKSNQPFSLDVLEPKDQSIVANSELNVRAKTIPFATVILTTDGQPKILKANDQGNIEETVNLNEGVNEIFLTSVKENGEVINKQLLIVYEKK